MSAPAINDFVIKLANVNGTGSASANGLLMKAIFRMGVPVVGKNVFPSNIQGLPTWYEIRVTENGYRGRSGEVHVMVAMNAETYEKDMAELNPGGVLIYDSTWPRPHFLSRSDITVFGVPLARMCNDAFKVARSRILMKNMAYVGVVAALLDLDLNVIHELVREMFAAKPKLIDLNMQALALGFDYARENFDCPLDFRVKALDLTKGKVMIDGNTAAGLGCVFAGATFGAWYPITPSTSLMDGFAKYCAQFRVDVDTGKHKYCIIQAEDELAAAGMIIGAAWNGARAFTPTSGPGISLMSEFIGFAYYAEIPMVLFDVQRVGPSTGMPTRTQQCDLQLCAYASHGDTRHLLLFPADPGECFEMAGQALDLAERFQTPVFVLSDIDIGMNDWMVDELTWDDSYQPDRGKVLSADELENVEKFHRYLDTDGDHIPYRTLPGTHPKGAYFTRGSGHNKFGGYTEDGQEYKEVVDRLYAKWQSAAEKVPAPVLHTAKGEACCGIISLGSCDGAVLEAREKLEAEGLHLDYLRIRGFPFAAEIEKFIETHEQVFVVEQNRDAQLMGLLIAETNVPREKLVPILHYSGEPLDYRCVFDALLDAAKVRKTA
ncbi:2-oxoglutarate/2-oxoacid ferredoxin oxidoreductase, gamma subunit / 2-oxoglutarate/2-oxoacid ferredoxin oxidoreductase, alpha subunit [hydrothermal vent metagenome]|uniref:2-oxoglutarate/2-oxoacid ferredoxin oxidoreductase, gamma subunit / 2-oxoglutarate/2-oxoacid ferredoxin oxidoreductase, alpha subunit n=1 Tax=hydrothermal vent metagenome TaxID=652676 RepID=A0A3B0RWA7_9ZZZZ